MFLHCNNGNERNVTVKLVRIDNHIYNLDMLISAYVDNAARMLTLAFSATEGDGYDAKIYTHILLNEDADRMLKYLTDQAYIA